MAAEVKARQNKNPTIAFTLPISCQVCLGKVKNPVLCPNQHVFCGPCMEVWLQKNKQCPACRTSMTSGKKIIGGLSQQEDDRDKLTNPDLRKARFDLLYKEYENEFERMYSEIQLLKTENQILKQQRKKEIPQSGSESSKSTDTTHLLALTKKLQDATKQYEKVKEELSQLKQENVNLKDENLSLNRENQHVRQELAGRSPHRYGRITVSTLESKLASAEKDVTRLTKALERSDKYIEELESELEGYRGKQISSKRPSSVLEDKYLTNGDARKFSSDSKVHTSRESGIGQDQASRRQLFSDDTDVRSGAGEHAKHYYEQNGDYKEDYRSSSRYQNSKSDGVSNGKKRVTFDLDKNTNSTTSFDLELPSPLKMSANGSGLANGRSSPVKGVLKKSNNGASKTSSSDNKASDKSGYSTDLSKDSLSDSYNLRGTDNYSKDDDLLYLKSRSTSSGYKETDDTLYSKSRRKYSADDSILSEPSEFDTHRSRDYVSKSRSSDYDRNQRLDNLDSLDFEPPSRSRTETRDRPDLDDTLHIESELDELNISLTPEFTDCMKILNRAEKNVHKSVPDSTDVVDKYRSSDTDMDKVFRASTGSIGTKSNFNDDFSTKYKTDSSKFSSLDSYSQGRHVRSGSLDNLHIERPSDQYERPASALGGATSMYPPTSQNKYMGGLTTGRTSLTRTPSLDNLLITRPSSSQNKYGWLDGGYSSQTARRMFGEDNKQLDLNTVPGSGVASTAPVAAKHDIIVPQGVESRDRYASKGFENTVDSHAHDYTSGTYTGTSSSTNDFDNGRKFPQSGRQTPTIPISSGGGDIDKQYNTGRVTPTIPTHSEYMALSKPGADKYSYSTALTSSGRSTPTLTSDFTAATKSLNHYTSGPSSLPTDLSQKPPSGFRAQDTGSQRASYAGSAGSYSSLPPTYKSTSGFTDTNTNSDDFYSLPTYTNTANPGDGRTQREQPDMKYSISTGRNTNIDKHNYIPNSNYKPDERFSNVSKPATYNDNNYKDGTDFSNFSTKIGVNNNYPYSSSSVSQANLMSASSAGPSSSSSIGLGLSSYPGPSSYIPTSLTSLTSSSSYSTALSVPLTSTTSSYTSSLPASNYTSKPLDPITETGHFSYVSNVSGDYSSKNDTFALPEPKKRLFENSDDLDMSVSPIKSNRRY